MSIEEAQNVKIGYHLYFIEEVNNEISVKVKRIYKLKDNSILFECIVNDDTADYTGVISSYENFKL